MAASQLGPGLSGSQLSGQAGHNANSWWVVRGPGGDLGLLQEGGGGLGSSIQSAFGKSSLGGFRGYFLGDGPKFTDLQEAGAGYLGSKMQQAFAALGATPQQVSSITQTTDNGSIQQGGTAVVVDSTGKSVHGKVGSGDEAKFAPVIPEGPAAPALDAIGQIGGFIQGVFNQSIKDLRYGAVLLLVLAAGAYLFVAGGRSAARQVQAS